ncbi:MAG TPA: hypothetical protein VMU37_10210 [Caulobacteraceae bacterium]|nr:hypothetical protein [Caulobacteraceae bacterium]
MATPKPLPPIRPRVPVAVQLREAIARAEAEGHARPDMTLHLTRADDATLRRDRSIAIEDIRFSDGVMRYLDVRVVVGGVATSALETDPPA